MIMIQIMIMAKSWFKKYKRNIRLVLEYQKVHILNYQINFFGWNHDYDSNHDHGKIMIQKKLKKYQIVLENRKVHIWTIRLFFGWNHDHDSDQDLNHDHDQDSNHDHGKIMIQKKLRNMRLFLEYRKVHIWTIRLFFGWNYDHYLNHDHDHDSNHDHGKIVILIKLKKYQIVFRISECAYLNYQIVFWLKSWSWFRSRFKSWSWSWFKSW